MPDASELDIFVAPDVDVSDGDVVVIAGEGEFVEFEDRQTKKKVTKLRIPITCPNGKTKQLTLNDTTRRLLIDGYGSNSAKWVGKNALVSVVSKDVWGVIKKVVYLNAVK